MKIELAQAGNTLWMDLNHDGHVQKKQECIQFGKNLSREDAAKQLLKNYPEPLARTDGLAFVEVKKFSDFLYNPIKEKLQNEIKADIRILSRRKKLPERFRLLLNDLERMATLLPSIRFKQIDSPLFKDQARYDVVSNTLFFKANSPPDAFIHELSHALMLKAFTSQDDEYKNFAFGFNLDGQQTQLTYSPSSILELQEHDRTLPNGQFTCPTEKSKASSLANEVYAYQNQARFILFKSGLKASANPQDIFINYRNLITSQWETSTLVDGYDNYNAMLRAYLTKEDSLKNWVSSLYTRNQHPAFTKTDSCVSL